MIKKLKNKLVSIIFLVIGGLGGFLYWRFIGCSTGTCPIKSHWYTMTLYGMLMGWLIGDLIASFMGKKDAA
jgi:hypothetical protein